MDDLAGILGKIMETPGAAEQLQNLAQGLFSGGNQQNNNAGTSPLPFQQAAPVSASPVSASPGDSLLGGMSPDDISKMIKVIGMLRSGENDERSSLITALRPHLSPERQKRADEAVNFMKLIKIVPLISNIK